VTLKLLEYYKYMKSLIFIIIIFPVITFAAVDEANTPEVFQREYIYTNSVVHENIQTVGVYTCVALTIIDGHGNAALAHFDAATDIESSLSEILSNFSDISDLRVNLYGGQSPYRLEKELRNKLLELGLNRVGIVRNISSKDSMNINLNLKTGQVSQYAEMISYTKVGVARYKSDRLKFSKRIYRHEDSLGGGDYVPEFDESEFDFLTF